MKEIVVCVNLLVIVCLMAVATGAIGLNDLNSLMPNGMTLYEDGSWVIELLGGDISGCVSTGLCDDTGKYVPQLWSNLEFSN